MSQTAVISQLSVSFARTRPRMWPAAWPPHPMTPMRSRSFAPLTCEYARAVNNAAPVAPRKSLRVEDMALIV